jgi:ketosteroid isomerase-like protein
MKIAMAALFGLLVLATLAFGQQQAEPSAMANPSPNPAAANVSTETPDSVADHLKTIENRWMDAVKNKNADEMQKIEAPDYRFVMSDGNARGRQEDIAAAKNSTFTEASLSDMNVRVFGDTGIVTGVAHIKGTENGKDVSGDYRFTDVFVKRDGNWEAVNTDTTKVQ